MTPDELAAIREDAERTGYAPWKDAVFALLDHAEQLRQSCTIHLMERHEVEAERDRYAAQVVDVRDLHRPVSFVYSPTRGMQTLDVCPDCFDLAGVHSCGCWRDEDAQHLCAACTIIGAPGGEVPYPCKTIQLLDRKEVSDE